jgi:hypothetical protein
MAQTSNGLGFILKTPPALRVLLTDSFQGILLLQHIVPHSVNTAHGPRTKPAENLVMITNDLTGNKLACFSFTTFQAFRTACRRLCSVNHSGFVLVFTIE